MQMSIFENIIQAEVLHKGYIMYYSLYEMSVNNEKLYDMWECRLIQSYGVYAGVTANGYGVSFRNDTNVLELDGGVMVAQ